MANSWKILAHAARPAGKPFLGNFETWLGSTPGTATFAGITDVSVHDRAPHGPASGGAAHIYQVVW